MIWRWKPSTSTGLLPETLKFHTYHTPQEWTWLHDIHHILYLDVSGTSQALWRLNDATECQEVPRVALSKCQGYYCVAVRKQRGRGSWVTVRERMMGLGGLERRLSPSSYCYHQQHGEGGAETMGMITFHSALDADTLTLIKQYPDTVD